LRANFLCIAADEKPDDSWIEVIDNYGQRFYCIAVNHEEEAALRERCPRAQLIRAAESHELTFRVGLPETEPAARK
jgi:hypothetical protein